MGLKYDFIVTRDRTLWNYPILGGTLGLTKSHWKFVGNSGHERGGGGEVRD